MKRCFSPCHHWKTEIKASRVPLAVTLASNLSKQRCSEEWTVWHVAHQRSVPTHFYMRLSVPLPRASTGLAPALDSFALVHCWHEAALSSTKPVNCSTHWPGTCHAYVAAICFNWAAVILSSIGVLFPVRRDEEWTARMLNNSASPSDVWANTLQQSFFPHFQTLQAIDSMFCFCFFNPEQKV